MNKNKKKTLSISAETLRSLDPDEVARVHGGGLCSTTAPTIKCQSYGGSCAAVATCVAQGCSGVC